MKTRRANGEGGVYKDGNRYKGYINIGTDVNGKKIKKYFTGKTKSKVTAAMSKYKEDKGLLNFSCLSHDKITLEKYALLF